MRIIKIIIFAFSMYGIRNLVLGRYNLLEWIVFRESFLSGLTAVSAYILVFSIVGELFGEAFIGRYIGASVGLLIAITLIVCRCI